MGKQASEFLSVLARYCNDSSSSSVLCSSASFLSYSFSVLSCTLQRSNAFIASFGSHQHTCSAVASQSRFTSIRPLSTSIQQANYDERCKQTSDEEGSQTMESNEQEIEHFKQQQEMHGFKCINEEYEFMYSLVSPPPSLPFPCVVSSASSPVVIALPASFASSSPCTPPPPTPSRIRGRGRKHVEQQKRGREEREEVEESTRRVLEGRKKGTSEQTKEMQQHTSPHAPPVVFTSSLPLSPFTPLSSPRLAMQRRQPFRKARKQEEQMRRMIDFECECAMSECVCVHLRSVASSSSSSCSSSSSSSSSPRSSSSLRLVALPLCPPSTAMELDESV